MTAQQQKKKMKKSAVVVTFKPTVIVKPILRIDDYTIEEIQNCFYSINEYREFKLDIKRTAQMMDMKQHMINNNDEEEEFTERGIENYIPTSTTRKQSKLKALNAVLNEQMRQYYAYDDDDDDDDNETDDDEDEDDEDVFIYDDEKIAAAYNKMARDCVAAAYIIGLSDAVIAATQNHHQEKKLVEEPSSSRPEGTVLSPLMKSGGSRSKLKHRRTFLRRRVFNAAA